MQLVKQEYPMGDVSLRHSGELLPAGYINSVMLSLFPNFGVACLVSPFHTVLALVQ